MSTQTMSEKEMFVSTWERETATTLRVLKSLPAGKEEFRPAPKSATVRQLVWNLVGHEGLYHAASSGTFQFAPPPPAPAKTVAEMIAMFESMHRDALAAVKAAPDSAYQAMIKFPVGPGQMADLRTADVMWTFLMDAIHHRGQMSVYLRLLDAKVPSIYGPTADEPWTM